MYCNLQYTRAVNSADRRLSFRLRYKTTGTGRNYWSTYNWDMETSPFLKEEFTSAIILAGARARLETLKAGVAVFYRDWDRSLDVMEQPDGRKFEVCFIAGATRESNYRVIRQLEETAA